MLIVFVTNHFFAKRQKIILKKRENNNTIFYLLTVIVDSVMQVNLKDSYFFKLRHLFNNCYQVKETNLHYISDLLVDLKNYIC